MIVDGSGCEFPPLKDSALWRYSKDENLYKKLENEGYEKKEINQLLRILKNNNYLK